MFPLVSYILEIIFNIVILRYEKKIFWQNNGSVKVYIETRLLRIIDMFTAVNGQEC